MTEPRSTSRVVLHVGLPKSGTTYLQASLARNVEALREQGVLYPQTDDDVMFRAALDVRGVHKAWGRRRKEVSGSWDAVCAAARAHPGTTVISHELLAPATSRQVDAALSLLKGLDVHVVVTSRDPVRQLVSEWQEGIKHGRRLTFDDYVTTVREGESDLAHRFAAAQSLPDVAHRWSRHLPADRVHVVVGPGPDDAPDALWGSFAAAVGFDPDGAPAAPEPVNTTLAVEQIDLLRRVNVALDGRLRQPAYGQLAKHRLAHELLAGRGGRKPQAPPAEVDALAPVADQWVKEIEKAGWLVHGDLADLAPTAASTVSATESAHPDEVDPRAQVQTAADVIASLLLDLAQARHDMAEVDAKRRSWKKQVKKLRRALAET